MILFSDFDGTLFRRGLEGDFEENLEKIKLWRKRGNKFALTTGRGLGSILAAFPELWQYVDYLICDNGALCYSQHEKLFEVTLDEDLKQRVVDYLKSLPGSDRYDVVYYREDGEFGSPNSNDTKVRFWTVDLETMERITEDLREQFEGEPVIFFEGHTIIPNPERKQPFLRDYHHGAIDVMAADAGKQNAIHRILERNPGEAVITVGDGGNDMDMLEGFDGYIMANASDVLKSRFDQSHITESVAELLTKSLIFDDISKKIGVNLAKSELKYYDDGSTDSIVFSADEKYLIKISDERTIREQTEFLTKNTNSVFQPYYCSDDEIGYECLGFLEGVHYKEAPIDAYAAAEQIAEIVKNYAEYPCDNYGFMNDMKPTWYDFLLDEIEYASQRIPDLPKDRVMAALEKMRDAKPEQRMLHGDFGTHNFLVKDGQIRVIDPMPVVGDKLYDFYFAILSNIGIFPELGLDYIFSYFDEYERDYKEALLTIALYVRTSRAAAYDAKNLDRYVEMYMGR